MRIHLGHHFYGAGNLGDDFMLAGFLGLMAEVAPGASYTCAVPFPREPLQRRFPGVTWLAYDAAARRRAIAECDAWLGLGGSPFQHALSRWFLDHLLEEAAWCAEAGKPMHYLGIGVQGAEEPAAADVARLCGQARGIWTRDPDSAEHLCQGRADTPVVAGADLAHLLFARCPPPPAASGTVTLVPNFDFRGWPGREDCLRAIASRAPRRRVWLAQESRDLPGAERVLHAGLTEAERAGWELVAPDERGAVEAALARWPSGEWLVTSRYHAALAGGWAGSRVVVIGTNRKLEAAARELGCPRIDPAATETQVRGALEQSAPSTSGAAQVPLARRACLEWARAVRLTA